MTSCPPHTHWCSRSPLRGNPRGAKAKGLTYERRLEPRLRAIATDLGWEFRAHPWIHTPAGAGAPLGLAPSSSQWLQPDFLLIAPSCCCLLLEAKLTWTNCQSQLMKYQRALQVLGHPSVALQVFRNLTSTIPAWTADFYSMAEDLPLWMRL